MGSGRSGAAGGVPTPTGIIMKKKASQRVLRPAGAASSMKGAPRLQKEASPRPTCEPIAEGFSDTEARMQLGSLAAWLATWLATWLAACCRGGFRRGGGGLAARGTYRHTADEEKAEVWRDRAPDGGSYPAGIEVRERQMCLMRAGGAWEGFGVELGQCRNEPVEEGRRARR